MGSPNANKRMQNTDPVFAIDDARRWGARALLLLANLILRCSITLYDRQRISSILLRTALALVRILRRSARIALFGARSVCGNKPHRRHRQ
jgi:hypothetical protein